MWKGEFTSKYIEEICTKAGSAKPYSTFVQMVHSALDKLSNRVFVDLLT